VSTHKEVRQALLDSCLFFYLVYPHYADKDLFLERYRKRGSPPEFIALLDKNWDAWIDELTLEGPGCHKMVLPKSAPYLSDWINRKEQG
jgi:hypothetical protein